MKGACRALVLVFGLLSGQFLSGQASAVAVDEAVLEDPADEQRARGLMKQLRCLVCQNQSIDESDAELAFDLRRLVRERIALGETDDQVRAFLVGRYGDWILLKPPLRPATLVLWIGPALMVGGGLVVVVVARRRRATQPDTAPLSAEESARLGEITGAKEGPG